MTTAIRKIGNSAGLIIPSHLLESQGLEPGSKVDLRETDAGIEIVSVKPRYTLQELLKQCDPTAPMPEELATWDAADMVGNELL